MKKNMILATSNPGKIQEFSFLFPEYRWSVFDGEMPLETGQGFMDNALIKASHVYHKTRLPVLADDSGLCIKALGGDPGVLSARLAHQSTDARISILEKLGDTNERNAYFITCLVQYTNHQGDPSPRVAYGRLDGHISRSIRGQEGFGYDSIFIPKGRQKTLGEIKFTMKQKISHRAYAAHALRHNMLICTR